MLLKGAFKDCWAKGSFKCSCKDVGLRFGVLE